MYTLRKIGFVALFIGIVAGIIAIIMLLWNALCPELFNLPLISYWQAGGLLLLCKLLFGGFGRGPHHHGKFSRHRHLHEKVKGMTREERREFIRKRMAGFCNPNEYARPTESPFAENQ
ncbi:MAG: hypothetical protein LIO65_09435 [Odoribacter sp.]|nr:hypothetical protein [Odoribacter sp.]